MSEKRIFQVQFRPDPQSKKHLALKQKKLIFLTKIMKYIEYIPAKLIVFVEAACGGDKW